MKQDTEIKQEAVEEQPGKTPEKPEEREKDRKKRKIAEQAEQIKQLTEALADEKEISGKALEAALRPPPDVREQRRKAGLGCD